MIDLHHLIRLIAVLAVVVALCLFAQAKWG